MVLIVRYTTDGIYTKNTTQMYVALTRCDRVIVECTVNYCCLLPYYEAMECLLVGMSQTCGLVVRVVTSCLVGRISVWFESWPGCTKTLNCSLLQSGQVLGIMS